MEYLVLFGMSFIFWLPFYVAAIYCKFSKLQLPKKLLFCSTCLVISYGSLGLVAPFYMLHQNVLIYLVHDWTLLGYEDLAWFFIQSENVITYITYSVPIIATFIIPFKLAPKWQSLVKSYG